MTVESNKDTQPNDLNDKIDKIDLKNTLATQMQLKKYQQI